MGAFVRTNASATYNYAAPRSVFTCVDGTAVAVLMDAATFYIYTSSDRITWTNRASVTVSVLGSGIANWWASTIGSTDNIHISWRDSSGNIKYIKATKAAGPTYTFGAQETVRANSASMNNGRLDMECLSTDVPVVCFIDFDTPAFFYIYTRRTSDNTWVNTYNRALSTGTFSTYSSVSISRDIGGLSGNTHKMAFACTVDDTTIYQGDLLGVGMTVDFTTGATTVQPVLISNLFNAVPKSTMRDYQIFSPVSGRYDIMAAIGSGSLDLYCARFSNAGQMIGMTIAPKPAGVRAAYPRKPTEFDVVKFVHSGSAAGAIYKASMSDGQQHSQFVACVPTDTGITWIPPNYPNTNGDWWDYYTTSPNVDQNVSYLYGGGNRNLNGRAETMLFRTSDKRWTYSGNTDSLTPTWTSPANAGTTPTNTPMMTATVVAPIWTQGRQRVQYQLARDAAFTSNMRSVVLTAGEAAAIAKGTSSGSTKTDINKVLPTSLQINQGVWYARAQMIDPFQRFGTWSPTISFMVSHPPSTKNQAPSGGIRAAFGTGAVAVAWEFSSAWPGSTQSAYEVIVSLNDPNNPALILDTGKIVSAAKTATVTIPSTYKSVPLNWQVRVWDEDNVVGNYSPAAVFSVVDASTVAVTAPTGTVNNPTPSVQWTFTPPPADPTVTQRRVRVVVAQNGSVVYDSGFVVSSTQTFVVPPGYLSNTLAYQFYVIVEDSNGMQSQSNTGSFSTSWTPPTAPSYSVSTTNYSSLGYVQLSWTNAGIDATFIEYKVVRRLVGETTWTVIGDYDTNSPTYNHYDYLASSGVSYQYAVVQTADRFGAIIESTYSPTTVTPVTEDYWLIDTNTGGLRVRLDIVTDDSYTDEYEEETILLMGRGRRKEYGTHYGYEGSLKCKLYDSAGGLTARAKRQQLFVLKSALRDLYMRNPFGDTWLVAIGNMEIGRIAGVGQREFVELTIPYTQVS
jgi:hypothetical protein